MPSLELQKLNALHAVVAEGSFRAGAATLNRSPSSISNYIRQLEADVGTPLLARTTRTVTLTPAGRALIDGTYGSIRAIDRAAAYARRVGTAGSRRVRIGHNGTAAVHLVQRAIQALLETDPDTSLQLAEGPTSNLVAALLADRLDLALIRPPLHEERLEEEPLIHEALAAALPSGHALATDKTVRLADLADTPFILPPRAASPAVYDRTIDLCLSYGQFRPIAIQEANTLASTLALVAAGAGAAILPRRSGRARGVTYVRFSDRLPRLPLHLAWRRQDTNPALFQLRAALLDATGSEQT